ncbi:hypothetical protein BJ165DRAFT_1475055 [Panaeolus papilionaceus]|nr:hypothetical protein BJ165DRAFT_1475055 [Panaeolus papilionaceus]
MRRPTLRSDTKPSVATIPERAVLTNERLYTRARLLTLAKQHQVPIAQKSRAQIIDDLMKQRGNALEAPSRAAQTAKGVNRTANASPSHVVALVQEQNTPNDAPDLPHTSEKGPNPDTPPVPQTPCTRKQTSVEFSPILPEDVDTSTPINSPGSLRTPVGGPVPNSVTPQSDNGIRSPLRGRFLHYRRRFTTALRGLTPSPSGSPTINPFVTGSSSGDNKEADMSLTPTMPTRRAVRRRNPTPPPLGAQRFAALEPLSEEDDDDDVVSLVTNESPSLAASSLRTASSSRSSTEIDCDSDPVRLVKKAKFCFDWSAFGFDFEEKIEVETTGQLPAEEVKEKIPVWNSSGGLNLEAIPSVVKGGWQWDDITDLLRNSDFR